MRCIQCNQRIDRKDSPEYVAFMDFMRFHVEHQVHYYIIAGVSSKLLLYKGFPRERLHYECQHCGMEWDVIV
jgi:peptide subunit release factor 1 (eRF1)